MSFHHIPFEPKGTYHLYNYAVGYNNLFREVRNYNYFLKKLIPKIKPFCDVLAYCLLPDHFHFIICIKDKSILMDHWKIQIERMHAMNDLNGLEKSSDQVVFNQLIVREFAGVFNSYAQSFNKTYRRKGALFRESFRRDAITSDEDLVKLLCYVHNNPVTHGFAIRREEWSYSSYHSLVSKTNGIVNKENVVRLFETLEKYKSLHEQYEHLDSFI